MSWLSDLANKAENLLNNIDSSAADALGPLLAKAPKTEKPSSDIEPLDSFYNFSSDNPGYGSSGLSVRSHSYESEEAKQLVSHSPPRDVFNEQKAESRTRGSWEWDAGAQLDPDNVEDTTSVLGDTPTLFIRTKPTDVTSTASPNTLPSSVHPAVTNPRILSLNPRLDVEHHHVGVADSTTPGTFDSRAQIHSNRSDDIHMENKILQSEVSSLSSEVSDLLRRNVKISEENKKLHNQVDRLQHELHNSENHIKELRKVVETTQPPSSPIEVTSSDESTELRTQLTLVNSELDASLAKSKRLERDVEMLSIQLQESRHHQELTEKRLQVSLDQASRITQELSQYKEKAIHVLAMKEELIASLRESASTGLQHHTSEGSTDESIDSLKRQLHLLRSECDVIREEVTRWRNEINHRDLVIHDLETQLQAERESWRHSLESAEQHFEREKQLREDCDAELLLLRNKHRELEERVAKQKADFHTQLVASESELNRLRHLLTQRRPSSNSTNPEDGQMGPHGAMLTRTDPEHVLTLESRLRQLTDTLMSRQDALDSVLAQNHALKIRLERVQSDNESLASTLATEGYPLSSSIPMRPTYPSANGYGCARIFLRNSVIPRFFHPIVSSMDELAVRFTNLCRKWPLTRLSFLIYLLALHVWLVLASFLFLPSPIVHA